jgi:hypothetical protein
VRPQTRAELDLAAALVHCLSALHRGHRKLAVSAPVAQGIEHRPPEAGARVRISPGAQVIALARALFLRPQLDDFGVRTRFVHISQSAGPGCIHSLATTSRRSGKMPILIQSHHGLFVPQHLLDDLDMGVGVRPLDRPPRHLANSSPRSTDSRFIWRLTAGVGRANLVATLDDLNRGTR